MFPLPPKVPCSQVVTFAKKALEDASGSASAVSLCPVVKGLSKLRTNDAEEKLHPLLSQHGLSLPVPLTNLSGGLLEGFPRLKPIDFLKHMVDTGHMNKLLGGKQISGSRPMLQEFWHNFEKIHPDFGLFAEENIDLGLCIPIFAHADGGRGYKKSEFMVFNWSSAIGSGTGKKQEGHFFCQAVQPESGPDQSAWTHFYYSLHVGCCSGNVAQR